MPIAREVLYSTVCMPTCEAADKNLPSFFRTVSTRPELQRCVEIIHVNHNEYVCSPIFSPLATSLPNKTICHAIHQQFGINHRSAWRKAIQNSATAADLTLSLILLICPNVRSLAVFFEFGQELCSDVAKAAIKSNHHPDVGLLRLEVLSVLGTTFPFELDAFFCLPNLHTVNGQHLRTSMTTFGKMFQNWKDSLARQ